MRIEEYSYESLEYAYGIRAKIIATEESSVFMGSMIGILKPLESTRRHAHHEKEVFCIIKGRGIVEGLDQRHTVQAGNVIYLDAIDPHSLVNNGDKDLMFISFWWFSSQGAILNHQKLSEQPSPTPLFIFAPPPTPNGSLHLGHIAGPYLAADIFHRYNKQKKNYTLFITGTDDHQSYVRLKSRQENWLPENIVDHYSQEIKEVWHQYNIKPDIIDSPLHETSYKNFVLNFIKSMLDKDIIKVRKSEQPFCTKCQIFLFEAHIGGYCFYCGERCGGGPCENCGMPHDFLHLCKPFCKYCKQTPQLKKVRELYFPINDYKNNIKKKLENMILPARVRSLIRKLLENDLDAVPVSYYTDWGLPIDFHDCEGGKLCSWIEMVAGYLYHLHFDIKTHCLPDEHVNLVLFFGYDNTYFYTIVMVSFLLAVSPQVDFSISYVYNEFYLLDDIKFSTSRQHAIWAKDIIQDVNADSLRYYLALTRPEHHKTGFKKKEYQSTIFHYLEDELSQWIKDVAACLRQRYNDVCPDGGEFNVEHRDILKHLSYLIESSEYFYTAHSFSPSSIIKGVQLFIEHCKIFTQCRMSLESANYFDRVEHCTSIALELTALKYIAMVTYPIMPDFCRKIYRALSQSEDVFWQKEIQMIPRGTPIINLSDCTFDRRI